MMYTSASLNNKGIEQEKEGDIQNAILTTKRILDYLKNLVNLGF